VRSSGNLHIQREKIVLRGSRAGRVCLLLQYLLQSCVCFMCVFITAVPPIAHCFITRPLLQCVCLLLQDLLQSLCARLGTEHHGPPKCVRRMQWQDACGAPSREPQRGPLGRGQRGMCRRPLCTCRRHRRLLANTFLPLVASRCVRAAEVCSGRRLIDGT